MVVVIRIAGSVSDLLVDVVTRALIVVVLTLEVVTTVCGVMSARVPELNVQSCDLVRLTVFTRVDVRSWVMALAVVVTVARVASFVTVDVKGRVVVVNFLVEEVNILVSVTCFPCQLFSK